jgi:hypothetical protein
MRRSETRTDRDRIKISEQQEWHKKKWLPNSLRKMPCVIGRSSSHKAGKAGHTVSADMVGRQGIQLVQIRWEAQI